MLSPQNGFSSNMAKLGALPPQSQWRLETFGGRLGDLLSATPSKKSPACGMPGKNDARVKPYHSRQLAVCALCEYSSRNLSGWWTCGLSEPRLL